MTGSTSPAPPPALAPFSVATTLRSVVLGYDVFISYRHADAKEYALALRDALKRKGLTTFVDVADAGGGASIEKMKAVACTSRALIVIVTDGVFESAYVRDELAEYQRRRIRPWWRRPLSRIIPVNVDGALSRPTPDAAWTALGDHVFIAESRVAVLAGTPSGEVVTHVVRSASFVRTSFFSTVIAAAVALAIAAFVIRGALQVSAFQDRVDSLRSEQAALRADNEELGKRATAQQVEIDNLGKRRDELTNVNQGLTEKNESLGRDNEALADSNRSLSRQSRALSLRSRAQRLVADDPVAALRLAEQAEELVAAPENRDLIRQSMSTWDLTYTHELGCSLDDVFGSTLLLRCVAHGRTSLAAFDVVRGERARLPVPAGDGASIVVGGDDWRVLVVDGHEFLWSMEPRTYRLYDRSGRKIGPTLVEPPGLRGTRCSRSLVMVRTAPGAVARWNTTDDAPTTSSSTAGCAPVDVPDGGRSDDVATVSRGPWAYAPGVGRPAPVGDLVALHDLERSQLVLHHATRKAPGAQIGSVRAFDWLPAGGALAYAEGQVTSDPHDADSRPATRSRIVIVPITDPFIIPRPIGSTDPVTGPRAIFTTRSPAVSLAFSPDEQQLAIVENDGSVEVIYVSGAPRARRARHPAATEVAWAGDRIITASRDDVRVWPLTGVHLGWRFARTERRYSHCAAADPKSRWFAVDFAADDEFWPDEPGGIALRDPTTGTERPPLPRAGACRELGFTTDGRWLIWVGVRLAVVWDTATWKKAAEIQLNEEPITFTTFIEDEQGFALIADNPNLGVARRYPVLLDAAPFHQAPPQPIPSEPFHRCPGARFTAPGWVDAFAPSVDSVPEEIYDCGTPWQVRRWCEREALDPDYRACDVEFVPTELDQARRLVDPDFAR